MKFPCLFAFVLFVAFNEIISVPVATVEKQNDQKDNADIKQEIVEKVRDALTSGEGKKALEEILDHKNNKDVDEKKAIEVQLDVQDHKGNTVNTIQLAKQAADTEKEDELRNIIVDNVKDALDKGEGKDAIQQLVSGNVESTDDTEDKGAKDLGAKESVPAAIKDELEQDADTTNPDAQEDTSKDVPMLQTGESSNDYFNDPSIDMNDDPSLDENSKDSPADLSNDEENSYKFQDVADNNNAEDNAASNPGYFVSEPWSTNDDPAEMPNDLNDAPDASVTSNDEDQADDGYFVSEPFTADEDSTKLPKDVQKDAAKSKAGAKPVVEEPVANADLTEEPVDVNP